MSDELFTRNEDGTLSLKEAIGQAIGAGSTCWVGGTGGLEFDSIKARGVVDSLYQFILRNGNPGLEYIWIVKSHKDPNDLDSEMQIVSMHSSEDSAFRANRYVSGPGGHPEFHGGEIWKVELGQRYNEHMIFGPREDWNNAMTHGWTDLRDAPDEDNPEWIEFRRLQDIFDPRRAGR